MFRLKNRSKHAVGLQLDGPYRLISIQFREEAGFHFFTNIMDSKADITRTDSARKFQYLYFVTKMFPRATVFTFMKIS